MRQKEKKGVLKIIDIVSCEEKVSLRNRENHEHVAVFVVLNGVWMK